MIAVLPFCMAWVTTAAPVAMRREHREVVLSAEGGVSESKIVDTPTKKAASLTEPRNTDYCNADFPLGTELSNDCGLGHTLVIDKSDCRQAAVQAGINISYDYDVPYDHYMFHPEGCFTAACDAVAKPSGGWLVESEVIAIQALNPLGTCYWYNPSPTLPNAIASGKPVCKRDKIIKGTENTGLPGPGCPGPDYQAITTEAKCREFAGCLGHCVGAGFGGFDLNKDDADLYNNFPKYCFIHHDPDDECVYFNNPRPGMVDDPTNPVGTPLCNVTAITHFPAILNP